MADVRVFAEGGYRYIKAVFQYSGGVAAQPGFEIERAMLSRPLPLPEGFAAIKAHLKRLGRPLTAFCACELRSPAPFSEQGFKELNQAYAKVLEEWGIYRDGENPVARSNVCPAIAPPAAVFFTPSPTRCRETAHGPQFRRRGRREDARGQAELPRLHRCAGRHLSRRLALQGALRRRGDGNRLAALDASWSDASAAHIYTVHNIGELVGRRCLRPGPSHCGLTWQYCRPPIVDLEFEMDVRAVREVLV